MQVQVGGYTYSLADGPVAVAPGNVIRVQYEFKYQMPKDSNVELWASLYTRPLGNIDRVEEAQTKEIITLQKSVDWKTYQGQMDIVVGALPQGIYGLIVEIPEQDAGIWKDSAIQVGSATGMMDMVTAIMPLMLIMMMAPMMSQAFNTQNDEAVDGQD